MTRYRTHRPRPDQAAVTVWVVEDHQQTREAVTEIIGGSESMECPVAVSSMEEMLHALEKETGRKPDAVLLDLGLPGLGGIEGISLVKEAVPGCKVVVFTVSGDERKTKEAIRSGADGYLLKDERIDRIPEYILQSVEGGAPVSAMISRLFFHEYGPGQRRAAGKNPPETGYKLSSAELRILALTSRGMAKKDISEALDISYHRIDYYMRMIFKKLDVRNVHGAVGKALREGLIEK